MMKVLLGTWQGAGIAMYPTIMATKYREELTFTNSDQNPILQVEQKTWQLNADGSETLLHWEFGFIRRIEKGVYEWSNTQHNGRVEVLQGTTQAHDDGIALAFTSKLIHNDPRVLDVSRRLEINGDELRYWMSMATTYNPSATLHLEAVLQRAYISVG